MTLEEKIDQVPAGRVSTPSTKAQIVYIGKAASSEPRAVYSRSRGRETPRPTPWWGH
jgi:hypothetical protein